MTVFNTLMTLFYVMNIIGVSILILSCVLTYISKKRKSIVLSINIVFPEIIEQITVVKTCLRCSTIVLLLNWFMCSSYALQLDELELSVFSETFFAFAIVFSIAFLGTIVLSVILTFFKSSDSSFNNVKPATTLLLWYSILYYTISLLLA